MREESRRWLEEARWDLGTARDLHEKARYNAACFYAQQAAGEAVKTLIYSLNEAPWGHSVRILLERYIKKSGDEAAERLLSDAREPENSIETTSHLDIRMLIQRGPHMRHTISKHR